MLCWAFPVRRYVLLLFGDTALRGEDSLLSKILIIIMHAICKTSLPSVHVTCTMLESVTPLKLYRVVILSVFLTVFSILLEYRQCAVCLHHSAVFWHRIK